MTFYESITPALFLVSVMLAAKRYFTPLKQVKAVPKGALIALRRKIADWDPAQFKGWVDLEDWINNGGRPRNPPCWRPDYTPPASLLI